MLEPLFSQLWSQAGHEGFLRKSISSKTDGESMCGTWWSAVMKKAEWGRYCSDLPQNSALTLKVHACVWIHAASPSENSVSTLLLALRLFCVLMALLLLDSHISLMAGCETTLSKKISTSRVPDMMLTLSSATECTHLISLLDDFWFSAFSRSHIVLFQWFFNSW